MSGNSVFRHHQSGFIALAAVEAPRVVTSDWIDEQLAETYKRNGVRPGLLADVAGIVERRWAADDETVVDMAIAAAERALADAGIRGEDVGVVGAEAVFG